MSGGVGGAGGAGPVTVAIDGPSGSGKSSVARAVASAHGLAYLDTGAMYRAAALAALRGFGLDDPARVVAAVREMPLKLSLDPHHQRVYLADDDVTSAIRETRVSEVVSIVATNREARALLVERQQALVRAERLPDGWSGGRGIVAEGRDITTVIAPDAEVRVLLTASEAARLRRRSLDVHGSAAADAVEATRDQVLRRDRDDSRAAEFLVAAPGVVTVDSSEMTLEETIDAVMALVEGYL